MKYHISKIKILYNHKIQNIEYPVVFLCDCHGIALSKRGINDNHILLNNLTEDDENWFHSDSSLGSSTWISEYIKLFKRVEKYMKDNCTPDMGIYDKDVQYGYKFKEK